MQRTAFAQRHAQEAALGRLGGLADRLRHLARLAVAEPHPALLVADDDQRGKAEAPAALHHLRHAIDVHELVDKFAVALLDRKSTRLNSSHLGISYAVFCLKK